MPEAVIVDAARSPIGRAFKGSLAQLRPEETAAYIVDKLLERNPDVSPEIIEDVYCGCGMPQGLQAFNVARIIALLSEQLPQTVTGTTISRYCASSLDAIRHAANAIKAGEGDAYVAAGVEFVCRFNERTEPAGRRRPQPEPDRRERPAQRLHRHGPDRGQRREEVRGQPRRHGQVRAALAGARRRLAGGRLLRPRDRPGDRPGRQRGRQGRRPARLVDAREALRAARGVRRRRRHRRQLVPAQRRRRRGAGDVGHEGQGARPDAEGARSSAPRPGATSPSTWASPRSARSRRSSTGPG